MIIKPKWYNTALRIYKKDKLEEPFRSLFRYYMYAACDKLARGTGHFDYFNFEELFDAIDTATENLRSVLPDRLYQNYISALEAYKSLGEDPEYEQVMAAFEQQDEYVWSHCEEITELLINHITKITEKSFIRI